MMRLPALAATLVLGLCAVGLSACGGFTPLYAAPGVSPKLAAIDVKRPDGRLGYLMGQFLEDSFARDPSQPAIYRLSYGNRELRVPRGITIENVASRYEVDLTTTYTLTEIATNKVITKGNVSVNVTYDVVSAPYAALAAVEDGERRAAEQAADRIRIELAGYFAVPHTIKPGAEPVDLSTFSDRIQSSVIQSPRERALGEPTPQAGQTDVFGQPMQSVVSPDQAQAFSPSEDPNNAAAANPTATDPSAIKTIPDTSGQ